MCVIVTDLPAFVCQKRLNYLVKLAYNLLSCIDIHHNWPDRRGWECSEEDPAYYGISKGILTPFFFFFCDLSLFQSVLEMLIWSYTSSLYYPFLECWDLHCVPRSCRPISILIFLICCYSYLTGLEFFRDCHCSWTPGLDPSVAWKLERSSRTFKEVNHLPQLISE